MAAARRYRHPRKDLEAVCVLIERAGWRVISTGRYFKAFCPCGGHFRTIHLTPSGANYLTNLTHWFRRQPCWKEPSA